MMRLICKGRSLIFFAFASTVCGGIHMEILISVLLFVVGVILVIKGGDWFVDAASWIARAAKIPPFIVGATIVSFATTLPEMIVSVMASAEGKNEMAVGNAIGSVTANTGLIMAIAFLFMVVSAPRAKFYKQYILLVLAGVVLWLGSYTGTVQLWASLILIAIFVLSLVFNVKDAGKEKESAESIEVTKKKIVIEIVWFVVGAVCIVLGSNFLINGGSAIATAIGVPERVIAVTMVAIGTSLPELVTTLTAIRKKEAHMSIGNIIGANIIDLSLILPVCSFISSKSFTVSSQSLAIDFPACILITLMAVIPLALKEKAYKVQGALMLLTYIGYLAITI
jgi:K+-dependent Na+/Ca+ exchanger related-protein